MEKKMIAGVGIDIVEVERLSEKPKLWERFLSAKEFKYLEKFKFKEEHVAGIWAAKEALVKATNNREIIFCDVSVAHDGAGRPYFEDFETEGTLHLSISHEKHYATAVVVWEK